LRLKLKNENDKGESKMQRNQTLRRVGTFFAFLALAAMLSLPAAAQNRRPRVVIIRADWCTACQRLEPTMMQLMEQYRDRLDFVVLDVTNEQKLADSTTTARRLGLNRFFRENQQRTSTVAVFVRGSRPQFQTIHNYDRDAYVRAFDEAIAQANRRG